jgi:serine/threonine-protein phosphatase 2A regulatory subunit B''
MEKIPKIHQKVKNHIRYKLCQKMMENNLIKWFSIPSTMQIVTRLIEDCKKSDITISTPLPFFANLSNSLTNSQIAASHFIPPVSPNSNSYQNFQIEKKNFINENTKNEEKKLTESLSNSLMTSMKLSKIPKFYFPEPSIEFIAQENTIIDSIFKEKNELNLQEFLPITKDFYNFPPLYNIVLFNKIDTEKTGKITRQQFIKFHMENFRGCSNVKKYFNFIKNPKNKEIVREDFVPFLKALLELNQSLDFLKEHPTYQQKYSDTVIMRIFYTNDINDDGKITLHDFKKSNIIEILKRVSEDDINNVRPYFSYEHFYVIYCIFFELDSNREPENELFISKEAFSRYDGHSLGKKVVDRIFDQIPRKFKSTQKDKMCFEDFLWYLLSEEDKTNRTSIEYWFKVLDLDNNGIITPSEMEYFYSEQEQRLESNQNDPILFADAMCQLYDMIPPSKEYQWTLQNFLDHPKSASIAFNCLFNYNKFVANELKDPFNQEDVDRLPDYSDWDKFAYKEYIKKMSEENDEGEEEEPMLDSNDETGD